MCTLKDNALFRISNLADRAIKNDPFGDDVDKAEVVAPFSELMNGGNVTAKELLELSDEELLRRLSILVAARAFAYGGSLLTDEQLDMIEESTLGQVWRIIPKKLSAKATFPISNP